MEDRLYGVPSVEPRWSVARGPRHTASNAPPADGAQGGPQRARRRQPIGEDDGKRGPRGYDAGKKVSGRKRHIAVDTEGLLTALVVHAADVQDREGARPLLKQVMSLCATVQLV